MSSSPRPNWATPSFHQQRKPQPTSSLLPGSLHKEISEKSGSQSLSLHCSGDRVVGNLSISLSAFDLLQKSRLCAWIPSQSSHRDQNEIKKTNQCGFVLRSLAGCNFGVLGFSGWCLCGELVRFICLRFGCLLTLAICLCPVAVVLSPVEFRALNPPYPFALLLFVLGTTADLDEVCDQLRNNKEALFEEGVEELGVKEFSLT
ncbi:hypothetical protein Droror1_Dr00017577 [Drosera rotundifolia]